MRVHERQLLNRMSILSTRNLIIVALILLVLGFYKTFESLGEIERMPVSKFSTSAQVSTPSVSRKTLTPQKVEDEDRNIFTKFRPNPEAEFRPSAYTGACNLESMRPYFPFFRSVGLAYVNKGARNRIILRDGDYCLQENKSYPIVREFRGSVRGAMKSQSTYPAHYGKAKVEKVTRGMSLTIEGLYRAAPDLVNDFPESYLRSLVGQKVAIIEYEIVNMHFSGAIAPLCLDQCNEIFFANDKAWPNLARMVDLRSASDYGRWHYEKAYSVPYNPRSSLEKVVQQISQVVSQDQSIVLYGYDMFDESPLIVGRALRQRGFTKVGWIWEGARGLRGIPTKTPVHLDRVTTLTEFQLSRAIDKFEKILLTTSRSPAKYKPALKGTQLISYQHHWSQFSDFKTLSDESLTREALIQAGEELNFEEWQSWDRGTPILVYGEHFYDWAAVKVLIHLRELGFYRLSWYRPGERQLRISRSLSQKAGP